MSDDILLAFDEALLDGKLINLDKAEHEVLEKEFAKVSPEMASALINFAFDWGYDAATGPYGVGPGETPTADDILRAREDKQLSRRQAARLIQYSSQAWYGWETELSKMPPHAWELFTVKTNPHFSLPPRADLKPSPERIRSERKAANISVDRAARLVYKSNAAWLSWEAGERHMKRSYWELFLIKADAPNLIQ